MGLSITEQGNQSPTINHQDKSNFQACIHFIFLSVIIFGKITLSKKQPLQIDTLSKNKTQYLNSASSPNWLTVCGEL